MIDTSTAQGVLTGAALSTTSLVLGAQVDALVVGLIAAVFVSTWLESIDSRLKAASAVLFSAMLAGYGSPVIAVMLTANMPTAAASAESLRLLLAAGIGGVVPSLWPLVVRAFGKKISRCKL